MQSHATQQVFQYSPFVDRKAANSVQKYNLFLMPGPTPTLSRLSAAAAAVAIVTHSAVAVAVGLIRGLQAKHTLHGHCQSTASPRPGCGNGKFDHSVLTRLL